MPSNTVIEGNKIQSLGFKDFTQDVDITKTMVKFQKKEAEKGRTRIEMRE